MEPRRICETVTLSNILFVSSNRHSPWNGASLNEPDHIWGDLPQQLGCNLLVCELGSPSPRVADYKFGSFEYTTNNRFDKPRSILLLIGAFIKSNRKGKAFCLGVTFRQIISRSKRALLRQQWRSKDISIWHRAVIILTRELKRIEPDVVIFHNEFSPWGSAVSWACRRVGVPAVAHQHYAVNDDPAGNPYEIDRWQGLFPAGLLCVTEDQVRRWKTLPIPVALGGSRRSLWNITDARNLAQDWIGGVLFAPALGDSAELEEAIAAFPGLEFHVKPHPSSKIDWKMPNVTLQSGDFVSVVGKFEVVVTSSPTPILSLTAINKPYIHVTSYPRVGTCQCAETSKFQTYRDVIECFAQGGSPLEHSSSGCPHNLAPTLSRAEYESSLLRIFDEGNRVF